MPAAGPSSTSGRASGRRGPRALAAAAAGLRPVDAGPADAPRARLMFGCMFEAGPEPSRVLRCAYEAGVRAFDTAEMYPVPQSERTAGGSEVALGALARGVGRGRVFIASKVAGPCAAGMPWIGRERLSADEIRRAIDGSLARLGTDYVDLMMLQCVAFRARAPHDSSPRGR